LRRLDQTKTPDPFRRFFRRPDEQTLIFASDRTLRLWDLRHKELRATLSGPSAYIAAMDVSLDGRTVVAGSQEGMVRVWRATRE
jgi:WD40 repeat protein